MVLFQPKKLYKKEVIVKTLKLANMLIKTLKITNGGSAVNNQVDSRKKEVIGSAAIQLFQRNFLGTKVSSVDNPGNQTYQCADCLGSTRSQPKGDCCPLY